MKQINTIPVRKILTAPTLWSGEAFSIRKLQNILNGEPVIHDLHRHDFFFILAVMNGAGVHEIDFKPYQVTDNSVFILRPGQVHRLELSGASNGFLLEFDPLFYQAKDIRAVQRWKKASVKNLCVSSKEQYTKLHMLLENIFIEQLDRQDGFVEAIVANLDLFFIEYVRLQRHPAIQDIDSGYAQDKFDELIALLETSIKDLKHVSQYANLLSLSNYQLNAITKTAVGKTVSDLIDEQIILESKRYLLATANQVKEVADSLGYDDPSYFVRFFKKHTGYTPDAFRKSFK